jgi:Type I phosphodiesterase / nucleotide pyrophosphatase
VSSANHDPRVDELRQRLRSLGYLDAGVDRFVLGSARATRRPFSIALLSSLRVGALAAVLLGPAAAIGVSARLPGLVTGPRDALVVALYLAAFFGLSAAVASFVAGLLASALARRFRGPLTRRAHLVARGTGILVTVLCLVYLTLWWQTVIADVGWSAPVWTLSALAIAAVISVLLGHAVSVMSSAMIVAGTGEADDVLGASRRTSVVRNILAGGAAFGAAVLLLGWSTRSAADSTGRPPALTVVPSGLRLRVIAIDGFDARIFEDLSTGGQVPALTRIFQRAVAHLDADDGPDEGGPDPARVWTTVATGQPATIHGVHRLETRRVAGILGSVPIAEPSPLGRAMRGATDLVRLTRPALASGSERRAKTFWEVASEAGLRTTVVNWWATWPARTDAGTVLSDRATLRLEQGGELDAEVAPAVLYGQLRQRWPSITSRAHAMAAAALAPETAGGDATALLARSARLDALQLVLLEEAAAPGTDLSVVYLPGLDIAQHSLLGGQPAAVGASTLADRLEALKRYYVALDRLLVPMLTPGPDDLVIVVTEPGRVDARAGARVSALGAGAASGQIGSWKRTSVAPTILYALGVPVSRDLAGAPMVQLFTTAFVARYPVRFVTTYGEPLRGSLPRGAQPLDQEMIDRLRSLGYVR